MGISRIEKYKCKGKFIVVLVNTAFLYYSIAWVCEVIFLQWMVAFDSFSVVCLCFLCYVNVKQPVVQISRNLNFLYPLVMWDISFQRKVDKAEANPSELVNMFVPWNIFLEAYANEGNFFFSRSTQMPNGQCR